MLWVQIAQAELLYAKDAKFASIISKKIQKYSLFFLWKMTEKESGVLLPPAIQISVCRTVCRGYRRGDH